MLLLGIKMPMSVGGLEVVLEVRRLIIHTVFHFSCVCVISIWEQKEWKKEEKRYSRANF